MAPTSKVPTYPRPVSPLSAESLHLESQDVIYGNSQPSSDNDSHGRAAKRRRIEKLGEQYLRGDGLLILSAGLRGPFNSKWNNPWGKRGRAPNRAVAEIPETVGKPAKKLQTQESGCVKARDRKVEEWLRRSSAYSGLEIEEQSSPTPLRKQAKLFPKAPTEDAIYGPAYQLSTDFEMSKLVGQTSPPEPDAQPVERALGGADCPIRLEFDDVQIKRRARVSHAANADRAEFAALKSKRRVTEIAPSTTILSPFEYRRVSDGVQKLRKSGEIANQLQEEIRSMQPPTTTQQHVLHAKVENEGADDFKQLHNDTNDYDPPHVVTTSISSAVPAISTDTSRGSTANLPSAQPQSLDVPAPSTNNLAFEEPAQQSEPIAAPEAPPQAQASEDSEVALCIPGVISHGSKMISEQNQTPQVKDKTSNNVGRPPLPDTVAESGQVPDTQDMLAGMSPLTFSTIRKATIGLERLATPVTATKQRSEKPSKTASFVQAERLSSGPSQGSLKASLRISKGSSSVAVGKENKLICNGDGQINGQIDVTRPTKGSPLPVANLKVLKSALKPSGPPIRTALFTSTKGSTSTGIDGGQILPAMEDDAFDLDGTMDDLGIYLDTWDVEKEASSMEMVV